MLTYGFELGVEVNGRRIPEYGHNGRTYVRGERGTGYQIKFRNSLATRVLAVITVDNLSVLDGQVYNSDTTGYVVSAYGSLTVPGWRTSLSEVRAFEFSDKSGSYAGKTAGDANCGVIGVRVYSEFNQHYQVVQTADVPYWTQTVWSQRNAWINAMTCSSPSESAQYCSSVGSVSNSAVGSVSNSAPDFNLGTAYGASIADAVSQVSFARGLLMADMLLYYSDRDGLLKDGIETDKTPKIPYFPQAFGGFCKFPMP
jgi:hypothetical protein